METNIAVIIGMGLIGMLVGMLLVMFGYVLGDKSVDNFRKEAVKKDLEFGSQTKMGILNLNGKNRLYNANFSGRKAVNGVGGFRSVCK